MLLKLHITLIFTLLACAIKAQHMPSHRDFRFLEIRGHSGNHLYTGESLSEALSNGYGALQVRYGWQSSNPEGWQNMYLYPAYGFGWYSGFIGNPDLLGTPSAVYGFISFPLFHHHRHQMVIDPALGLSYDLKPFDEEKNELNDAIGSRFNVYFNLNIGARYRLNRELDFLYGLDITHFSNGRTFRPNAGLNMWGFNMGLRYHFNTQQNRIDNSSHPTTILDVRPVLEVFKSPEKIRQGSVWIYGAGGLVQNDEDKGTGKQYGTITATAEYQYKLNSKNGLTGGLNFFYDNSLKSRYPDKRHDFYGAHAGYDFMFWQLTLRMQVGSYLHARGHDLKGNFFFRPAIKIDAGERFYFQLGLKTQAGFKADWVEYGVGVRLWQ
ncbi:acyloxyacyl hydrolase [Natronoflexus pectinivorans]|nr:acyloxyacyl hydrolase [Natronoflexus pectinivorans]